MSTWDDRERLGKMEKQRDALRKKGKRLTFDCFGLLCHGERAICYKGKRLGSARDGSISVKAVLRGETSGTCKHCEDFTTEEEERE